MKMTSSVMFLAINAPLPHSSRQHMLFRRNSRTGSMALRSEKRVVGRFFQ
jgi:hypothetical protein